MDENLKPRPKDILLTHSSPDLQEGIRTQVNDAVIATKRRWNAAGKKGKLEDFMFFPPYRSWLLGIIRDDSIVLASQVPKEEGTVYRTYALDHDTTATLSRLSEQIHDLPIFHCNDEILAVRIDEDGTSRVWGKCILRWNTSGEDAIREELEGIHRYFQEEHGVDVGRGKVVHSGELLVQSGSDETDIVTPEVAYPMKPRLTVLTLGVDNLERAVRFYRDGLGWKTDGIVGKEFEHGAVAFFDLQSGLRLALWPRESMAHDTGLPVGGAGAGSMTLGHNVNSRQEVDAVMEQALLAGAVVVKPAQETFWGGYAGYFQDPDGHLWEVVWNPELVVE